MGRRAPAALGSLLLLLAACGNAGGTADVVRDSASQAVAEPTTTTTIPPPVTSTTTTTVAGRTTTTARARTTTTARAAATPTTVVPGAAALTPAAPGTYYYDTTGRSTFAGSTTPFPEVTTLVVDPPSGTRQRLFRNLRDAAGNGLASEFVLDYRPEGVFLVSLRLTVVFSGITENRDLRPSSPVLILATGARPGAHAQADLGGAIAAKLVIDVVGEERVTVAGRPVDTLVVRTTITLVPSDIAGRQALTLNIDRGTRLWVRERSVTDASAAGGLFTLHSEYSTTIQSLGP
jgi:hypothetical protein